ncbi:MAG: hypothetical protein ACFFCS_02940 [Candidatus Hodarchaeota archaeon]
MTAPRSQHQRNAILFMIKGTVVTSIALLGCIGEMLFGVYEVWQVAGFMAIFPAVTWARIYTAKGFSRDVNRLVFRLQKKTVGCHVMILGITTIASIPWILACFGFHSSDVLLVSVIYRDIGHLGFHHGFAGFIAIVTGIFYTEITDMSRDINPESQKIRIYRILNRMFAYSLFLFGTWLVVDDMLPEQFLIKSPFFVPTNPFVNTRVFARAFFQVFLIISISTLVSVITSKLPLNSFFYRS